MRNKTKSAERTEDQHNRSWLAIQWKMKMSGIDKNKKS